MGTPEEDSVVDSTSLGQGEKMGSTKQPWRKNNIFSWLFLCWLEPLLCHGMRHDVSQDDLYPHPSEADSQKLLETFNHYWKKELLRREKGKNPRLLLTLIRCIPWSMLVHTFFYFVEGALLVSQSVMLGYLTESIVSTGDTQNAYLFGAGLVLSALLTVFIHGHNYFLAYKLGMITRTLMTGIIYEKVTTLSQVSIGKLSIGYIVNLASNDVQRFELAFAFLPVVWVAPFHWGVLTYLAYIEVGWSAFTILGFVFILTPLQLLLAKLFSKFRFKSALVTDKRIRIMNEIISGMKVIKMYAWEYAFKAVVSKLRKSESFIILKSATIRAVGLSLTVVSLPVMTFVVFSVYTATGGVLTPKKVFTVLSLIIILKLHGVHAVVYTAIAISEGLVAISRISKFLAVDYSLTTTTNESQDKGAEEATVVAENMSASWNDSPVLADVNFSLTKANPLLAVVGSVGSGKSTLLQVLLNELQPSSGKVNVSGALSYTSQEPWLFSTSLRDNILFGSDYDPVRYNAVIDACSLKKDISQLVNGDLTLVGERGVTLSGGQKARVSLARAIYHQADIYLLDDPLSAVDVGVAKHIFEKCIREFLADKLVILVTHQVQFAMQCDQLLGLKKGGVELYGGVSELLSRNVNLREILGLEEDEQTDKSYSEKSTSVDGDTTVEDGNIEPTSPGTQKPPKYSKGAGSYTCEPSLLSFPSLYSLNSELTIAEPFQTGESKEDSDIVVSLEERSVGSISFLTYVKYFLAGGSVPILFFMLLLLIFGEGILVVCDWWISDWAQCYQRPNQTLTDNRSTCLLSTDERIGIFAGSVLGSIILNLAKVILFSSVCVNASRVLHNRMLNSILHTPMFFFDTNPIGRILNRFSKDVGFLDDLLPYLFSEYIVYFSRMIAIAITAIVALPWLLIPCALLLPLFIVIRWYYLQTVRDLKRLEGLARSPVYSHISSTLQGLSIIRTFGKTEISIKRFHYYQNEHTRAYYLYQALTRWLGIRLDLLVTVLLAAVVFIAPPLTSVFDPALIGLAITYTLSLAGDFQHTVRFSADVESTMVSTERVLEYGKLDHEASFETVPPAKKPSPDWPSNGYLRLENVSFQYSPDLPVVLKNISFATKSAEKIGVVGRTGAGKSSILSVLFRLAEPCGLITVDGVDIQSIGLHDIRSKMSIIPQDPVLFSGTMRYNLDPFNEFSDIALWDVLEQVQLKSAVEQLEGGLAGEVSEGGSNFSVGQKQLVCLARAMLRKNKILILDEATANVDIRTDEIIQQAIRQKFSECTVITIAHRLNTILDSDRIMVLSSGEIVEFDTPFNLLNNTNSLLSEMVNQAGTAKK